MSLLLASLLASMSGAGLGWLMHRRVAKRESHARAHIAERKGPEAPLLAGFPCQPNDVVLRSTGEEAWLAGVVVLSERVPVAALFHAPNAVHDLALYVQPQPRPSVWWLEPVDMSTLDIGPKPPSALEVGHVRFERTRLIPLEATTAGSVSPMVTGSVLVAEYVASDTERLLVLKAPAQTLAYRGRELASGTYEVIAPTDEAKTEATSA